MHEEKLFQKFQRRHPVENIYKCHLLINTLTSIKLLNENGSGPSLSALTDSYRALLVEQSEGLLELCPHGLGVGILHQELSAELSKLRKLDGARSILINLFNQLCQLLCSWTKTHGSIIDALK